MPEYLPTFHPHSSFPEFSVTFSISCCAVMAEACCNAASTSPSNVSRPKKSRRTKRIIAARAFLKNISFDGKPTEGYKKAFGISSNDEAKDEGPKSRQTTTEEDRLISSIPVFNKVPLHHCISLACAGDITEDLQNQKSVRSLKYDEHGFGDSGKVSKSKSFITSSLDVPTERRSLRENSKLNVMDPRLFLGRSVRSMVDRRTVFVSRNALPFKVMSIMPYRKENIMLRERRITAATQISNTVTIEGIERAEGERVVSYSHLLVPVAFSKKGNPEHCEIHDETAAGIAREITDVSNDVTYDSEPLDDPELTSGKHRTVLNLKSYMVSIIQYAKPSEIKKDINERFKEKFPNIQITLTKLRSIKADMLEIGIKCGLEKATIACSHVYFEKLVIKEKINKVNRKYCAGACLILAAKFMEDIRKGSVALIIEVIMDKFRLHQKDLLSCELLVLIALEFSLCLPHEEILPLYRRLEGNNLVGTGHHIKSD